MLRIRLQRVGRKNDASFRVVVTEGTHPTRTGKYLEMVGFHNPHDDKPVLNAERIKHWIGHGAQPTDTVHNLLIETGIITGKKVNVLPRKSPPKKEEEAAPASEAAAPEVAAESPTEAPAEAPAGETPAETKAEAPTETPTEEPKKEEAAA